MNAATANVAPGLPPGLPPGVQAAELAQDLRSLAWLHAAARDAATWTRLHRAGFPIGLHLAGGEGARAMTQALEALAEARARDPQGTDDRLAADYAAIYLTHALRASPCESVWRDEDHLMLQAPTFAVREFYRRHGIPPVNWRAMPDDHLVHELGFVAHLLESGEPAAARAFLDRHLLSWLPQFAARVAERADTPVYAALALLTMDAARTLREWLDAAEPAVAAGF